MSEPRWADSQRAVEMAALQPIAVSDLIAKTGYSRPTVLRALGRGQFDVTGSWPKLYRLIDSAFKPEPVQDDEPVQAAKPIVKLVHVVEPTEYPTEKVGRLWLDSRETFSQGIAQIDMSKKSLSKVRSQLRDAASAILGVYLALGHVEDSPDWREQVGL